MFEITEDKTGNYVCLIPTKDTIAMVNNDKMLEIELDLSFFDIYDIECG